MSLVLGSLARTGVAMKQDARHREGRELLGLRDINETLECMQKDRVTRMAGADKKQKLFVL